MSIRCELDSLTSDLETKGYYILSHFFVVIYLFICVCGLGKKNSCTEKNKTLFL